MIILGMEDEVVGDCFMEPARTYSYEEVEKVVAKVRKAMEMTEDRKANLRDNEHKD